MSEDQDKKEVDDLSGVETTGHDWDGLKELNNPLPRWWVWIFLITVVWSVWYFIVYPAWPTLSGATEGTSGYTQYKELAKNQQEIRDRQAQYLDRFENASDEEVMNDPELYAFAMAGGASAFKDNCATCHGSGAEGGLGYPNLNDDDWLWGGSLAEIHQTLVHGIRVQGSYDTRISQMPAYGKDKLLTKDEINAVTDFVLHILSDQKPKGGLTEKEALEKVAVAVRGSEIFRQQCASCHGDDGKGLKEFGAPNLTDKIWLYGGDRASIYESVFYARAGMMPAWNERLDDNTIRQLTIYLHQLGGGEEDAPLEREREPIEE